MRRLLTILALLSLMGLTMMSYGSPSHDSKIYLNKTYANEDDNVTINLDVDWTGDENSTLVVYIYYDGENVELLNVEGANYTLGNETNEIDYIKIETKEGVNKGRINLANITYKLTGNGTGIVGIAYIKQKVAEPKPMIIYGEVKDVSLNNTGINGTISVLYPNGVWEDSPIINGSYNISYFYYGDEDNITLKVYYNFNEYFANISAKSGRIVKLD